jgi:CRP-like cAMP-binding protein
MNQRRPLTDVDSVMPILSKISFLGGIADDQRQEIFDLLEVTELRKGEYISKRGEEPSCIYIIKKGRVDVLITDDEVTVRKRQFNVGDCFGEAAMLSMNNNTASFVAAEDCELIILSRRALSQLRRENLDVFCILITNFARELARKLQFTDEILLKHGHELHRT